MTFTEQELERQRIANERHEMEQSKSEALDDAFIEGYVQALHDYAWWKNGVQYVGCGVKTLAQAIKECGAKTQ